MPWLLWLLPIRAVVEVGVAQGVACLLRLLAHGCLRLCPPACAL